MNNIKFDIQLVNKQERLHFNKQRKYVVIDVLMDLVKTIPISEECFQYKKIMEKSSITKICVVTFNNCSFSKENESRMWYFNNLSKSNDEHINILKYAIKYIYKRTSGL